MNDSKPLPPAEIGAINRKAVFDYFTKNLCHTQLQCAAALGLSRLAVGSHVKAIRAGWRPPVKPLSDERQMLVNYAHFSNGILLNLREQDAPSGDANGE